MKKGSIRLQVQKGLYTSDIQVFKTVLSGETRKKKVWRETKDESNLHQGAGQG